MLLLNAFFRFEYPRLFEGEEWVSKGQANARNRLLAKKKEISEDDEKQANEYIQKITDSYIGNADSILKDKETDLMQV